MLGAAVFGQAFLALVLALGSLGITIIVGLVFLSALVTLKGIARKICFVILFYGMCLFFKAALFHTDIVNLILFLLFLLGLKMLFKYNPE